IQKAVGSTFSCFSFFFVHPKSRWIDVFLLLILFRTSKRPLDRRFPASLSFSYIQRAVGLTFSCFTFFFLYPNGRWIDVFLFLILFRNSSIKIFCEIPYPPTD